MRRVYECVPCSDEPASMSQIATALIKSGAAQSVDMRSIGHALSQLEERKLVREYPRGKFRRDRPKEQEEAMPDDTASTQKPVATKVVQIGSPPTPAAKEPKPADIVDRIAQVGTMLRALSATATDCAQQVEELGLSLQERVENVERDTAKLRQLQAILKSL